MTAPPETERLYGLPLEEFTSARNALAADLAKAGRKDDAAAVKKLKKPSITAWVVNRLVRVERPEVERLLDLVDELKEARTAGEINALGAERRELVARLTRRAGAILEEAGHAASAGALQRVTQTLSAGGEEDERRALSTGTLSQDLAPTGFDALGAFGDAAVMSPPEPERDAEVEELQRLASQAEDEATRLTEEAERAEAAALRASEAASEARRRAREAREKAQRAARSAR
ncbi:MAG TPA: hypothetical protein VHI71_02015 [Actinomycetota bacterium]|nr:hypothetical protein [Actinomycetota bacterium]